MVDEFRALHNYYYFKPPLAYRSPMNTDELFQRFIDNPQEFKNFMLTMEYYAIRYNDITNDLAKIESQGDSIDNIKKSYYYKGYQECLKSIIMNQPITPK